jgi:hypothetical protein
MSSENMLQKMKVKYISRKKQTRRIHWNLGREGRGQGEASSPRTPRASEPEASSYSQSRLLRER